MTALPAASVSMATTVRPTAAAFSCRATRPSRSRRTRGRPSPITDAIADMTGSHDQTRPDRHGRAGAQWRGHAGALRQQHVHRRHHDRERHAGCRRRTRRGLGRDHAGEAAQATLEIERANGGLSNVIVDRQISRPRAKPTANGVLTLTMSSGSLVNYRLHQPGRQSVVGPQFHRRCGEPHHDDHRRGDRMDQRAQAAIGPAAANWTTVVPTAADDATIAPASTRGLIRSRSPWRDRTAHNLTLNDAHATLTMPAPCVERRARPRGRHVPPRRRRPADAAAIDIANGATFNGYGTVSSSAGSLTISGTVTASELPAAMCSILRAGDRQRQFPDCGRRELEFGGSVASGTTVTFLG